MHVGPHNNAAQSHICFTFVTFALACLNMILLADEFAGEMKDVICVKESTGMNTKRGVSCKNICSLLFLFLLGGIAGNMIMLQTTVMVGVE